MRTYIVPYHLVYDTLIFQMHTRTHDFSVNSITQLLQAVISSVTIVSFPSVH